MLRVFLRQLSARLRLFLRSSAKYTPFPKRRPCKALLFSTNLTVGSVGHESGGKNMKKPLELVSLCNCVPLNIFQHDFNGGTVPLPWRPSFAMAAAASRLVPCHSNSSLRPATIFSRLMASGNECMTNMTNASGKKKTLEKPVTI